MRVRIYILDNVRIPRKHPQKRDLAESSRRDTFFVLMKPRLLQCYDFASNPISRSVHLSVSTFPYLLKLLECLHGRCTLFYSLHFSQSLSALFMVFEFCVNDFLWRSASIGLYILQHNRLLVAQRQYFWISNERFTFISNSITAPLFFRIPPTF